MKKILLIALFLFLIPDSVYALTVSPSIVTLETEPDIPKSIPYEIYNETKQDLKVNVYVWDLWFNEKAEKVYAIPAKNNLKYLKQSVAKYFAPQETEFVMKPKEKKQVNILASVPQNITGGNTAVIFFQAEPFVPKGQTMIAMVSRIGSIVFQETKGTLNIKSRITGIDIKKAKYKPLEFRMKVKNEGNATVSGNIVVGILGENESFYGTFELNKKIIPDGKEISFEKDLPISLPTGNYNAVVTFNYKNKSVTVNKPFHSE